MLRGSGSGGDPNIGKVALLEHKEELKTILKDTDILFIVAGLGKGTGSGAAPELARIASELKIPTISIVTIPSIEAEGNKIYANSIESYENIKGISNSLCVISNDKIISSKSDSFFIDQFEKGNKEIYKIIDNFVHIISNAGHINIDYADLRNFLTNNQFFIHTDFDLPVEISFDESKKLIKEAIEKSYSNVNFSNEHINVIASLRMNSKANVNVISNIRKSIEEITGKHVSLVYGVEYTEEMPDTHVSLFISNHEQITGNFSSEYNFPSFQTVANATNIETFEPSTIDSFDTQEYKNIDTHSVTKKVLDIDEIDDYQINLDKNILKSAECDDILTKACSNLTSKIKNK
jgi:cell division protein FtsZ